MAFYKYDTELLNIVSSNLAVRRDGYTSNINFEITSNTETRIGLIVDDQFRGFMSNTNGLFFSSNNTAGFKRILGPGDLTISANPPLMLVGDTLELGYDTDVFTLVGPGSNLLAIAPSGITNTELANSNITIDGSVLLLGSSYANLALGLANASGLPFTGLTGQIAIGQIPPNLITGDKVALGTLTNNLLVNSNIQIGATTVELGSGIYSIPMSNISGTLPPIQLPTDFENISLSQVAITSGNITISNIHSDNLTTQTANITDWLWLGSQPSSNLALSGDGGAWQLHGANLSITSGNLDVSGNLWVGQNANIIGSIQVGSGITTQANISAGNLVVSGNITGLTANITNRLWLGSHPSANLSLSSDSGAWQLQGANLSITSGNLDVSGNLWVGQNANIIGSIQVGSGITTQSNLSAGNISTTGIITTAKANITDRLWLGSLLTANLALSGDGEGWQLQGANLGITSGNLDVGGNIYIGHNAFIDGNVVITGNAIIYGETTIINSNVVTVLDPVITLGGNTAPSLDDNMDRGVAFRWYDSGLGGGAKMGFFGFRDSDRTFRFIPDATDTNQAFTGANGSAHFNSVALDSNITLYDSGSLISWGTNSANAGIRLSSGNLEVKSNSTAGWQRLFTASEIIAGAALGKSGTDNLTLDVEYDNTSIGLNGSGQLALLPGGVANSNLANSSIIIGGTNYTLGNPVSNITLNGANAIIFGGYADSYIKANPASTQDIIVSSNRNFTVNSGFHLALTATRDFTVNTLTGTINTSGNIALISDTGNISHTAYSNIITRSSYGGLYNYANIGLATSADVLYSGPASSQIGLTLVDAANSVITMGGASLGTAGYGFRNNTGVMFYRNSADPTWTQLISLNQLVSGAGIGFTVGTNTLYTLTDNTTIETATTGTSNIRVKDGGITGVKLASGTITNDKLANTAITISGVGYTLGTSTNNLSITGSNLIVFGTNNTANIGLTGGANGNLAIQATGNVSIGKHLIAANTFTSAVYSNATLTNMSGTQTLALDFGESSSFLLTLAANADITLSNPGNVNRVGQQGVIYVQTPSTGSGHILRWYKSSSDSAWFFPGGSGGFAPSISVANSVYDVFNYVVISASPSPIVLVTDATGFSRYS
jgi:carbonic anhydrase/acetyltransferase-like protein (isoleucine patch superfamily)